MEGKLIPDKQHPGQDMTSSGSGGVRGVVAPLELLIPHPTDRLMGMVPLLLSMSSNGGNEGGPLETGELQPLEKGLGDVGTAPSGVSGELVQSMGSSKLSSNVDLFAHSRSNGSPESSATASRLFISRSPSSWSRSGYECGISSLGVSTSPLVLGKSKILSLLMVNTLSLPMSSILPSTGFALGVHASSFETLSLFPHLSLLLCRDLMSSAVPGSDWLRL